MGSPNWSGDCEGGNKEKWVEEIVTKISRRRQLIVFGGRGRNLRFGVSVTLAGF